MKRIFTIIAALLFATIGFSQQVTIAKWTFPTGNAVDTLADQANALNTTKSISTTGGVSGIAFKNGATTKAAQATNWNGGVDTKAWQVEINATASAKIQVSSKQTAGGSYPGPKDFKLQYRIGTGGTWTDVTSGTLIAANEWTTGVLNNVQLPDECNNQVSVFIRWVMTSNLDANGAALIATGIAKIDDISITGETISGISNPAALSLNVSIYPNPCADILTVNSENELNKIEIYSITGSKVFELNQTGHNLSIDTNKFQSGRYFLVAHFTGNAGSAVRSVIVES